LSMRHTSSDAGVAAHAHGTQSIKDAIRAGVDSVEHASLIDDEGIALANQHGTYLVFDIYNDDYILSEGQKAGMLAESIEKERQLGQKQRENFRRAHRAGVKLAFGTDAGVYPHGDNAKQFGKMVEWGMPPAVAIRTATVKAADLLGLSEKIGTISVNHEADIIAVAGDPSLDVGALQAVKFVMKGGSIFRDDLHAAAAATQPNRLSGTSGADSRLSAEILDREVLTWELEKKKDKPGYAALMAPGYVAVTDRGVMDTALNLREIDDLAVESYSPTDVHVRSIGQDVALLTLQRRLEGCVLGQAVGGGRLCRRHLDQARRWWLDGFYQETPMHLTGSPASPPPLSATTQVPMGAAAGNASPSDPLVDAERQSWEMARKRDKAAYAAFLAEEFVAVSEYGRLNKTQNVQDLDNLQIADYSLQGIQVHRISDEVAMLNYQVTARGNISGREIRIGEPRIVGLVQTHRKVAERVLSGDAHTVDRCTAAPRHAGCPETSKWRAVGLSSADTARPSRPCHAMPAMELGMKGDFTLDQSSVCVSLRTISRAGVSVRIEPRAMRVLEVLAQEAGKVVPKTSLIQAVWGTPTLPMMY